MTFKPPCLCFCSRKNFVKLENFKTEITNIKQDIFNVEQKIKELKIEEEKQALFLKKSLHQGVLHDFNSLPNFNNN